MAAGEVPGQMNLEEIDPSFSRQATEKQIDWDEERQKEKERQDHMAEVLATAEAIEFPVSKQEHDYEPFLDYFVNYTEEITDRNTGEKQRYQLYKDQIVQRLKATFESAEDVHALADAFREIKLPALQKEYRELGEEIDQMKDYHPSQERDEAMARFAYLSKTIESLPFLIQFLQEIKPTIS